MLDGSYEIDHIVPLYKGGGNGYENLMALCRNCHGKKTINDKLNLNTNASGNPNYQSYNLNNNYKNPISVNDKGEIYKKILIQKT
jgi:5-methylcytosine-specific restriction endonuclease McrA